MQYSSIQSCQCVSMWETSSGSLAAHLLNQCTYWYASCIECLLICIIHSSLEALYYNILLDIAIMLCHKCANCHVYITHNTWNRNLLPSSRVTHCSWLTIAVEGYIQMHLDIDTLLMEERPKEGRK